MSQPVPFVLLPLWIFLCLWHILIIPQCVSRIKYTLASEKEYEWLGCFKLVLTVFLCDYDALIIYRVLWSAPADTLLSKDISACIITTQHRIQLVLQNKSMVWIKHLSVSWRTFLYQSWKRCEWLLRSVMGKNMWERQCTQTIDMYGVSMVSKQKGNQAQSTHY